MPSSRQSSSGIHVTEMAFALCTTCALSFNVHKHESLKSVAVGRERVLEAASAVTIFYILCSIASHHDQLILASNNRLT